MFSDPQYAPTTNTLYFMFGYTSMLSSIKLDSYISYIP